MLLSKHMPRPDHVARSETIPLEPEMVKSRISGKKILRHCERSVATENH